MRANIEGKTLEYWITRATDPFVAETDRVKYIEQLCKGISKERDGPKTAFRLFSYKMLSPCQAEVLNTLKAADACVTRCGSVVHDELIRSELLEQIIKLLLPRFSGDAASDEVKEYAINTICVWRNSMGHLSTVKEAYKRLVDEGVVLEEQGLQRGAGESPTPSRKPIFNDEEKTRLLSKLLKSKKPKDLQAANRLIRSLVQTEEQKVEEANKRKEDIEKAKSSCFLLMEMMNSLNFRSSDTTENDVSKELYSTLLHLRPSLFRYACMAAEGDDNSLAEILTVNDDVNKAIELYKMINPHLCLEDLKMDEASCSRRSSKKPFSNGEFDKAEFSGPSTSAFSMQSPVRQCEEKPLILVGTTEEGTSKEETKCDRDAVDALTLLIEADIFPSGQKEKKTPEKITNKTSSQKEQEERLPPSSLDLLDPFVSQNEPTESEKASSALENVSCSLEKLQIGDRPSILIFDENNIRGMLHYAGPSSTDKQNIVKTVICISSTNAMPLNSVRLMVTARTHSLVARLLDAQSDSLPPFNPLVAQPIITQLLLVYPFSETSHEAVFDFKLAYTMSSKPQTIAGSFSLQL